MKRDLDLIRDLLLAIDGCVDDEPASIRLPHDRYNEYAISHHIRMLDEAGLIHAIEARTFNGTQWLPHSLTWQGHEFLEMVRHESVWEKVKGAAECAAAFVFLRELAEQESRKLVASEGGLPA